MKNKVYELIVEMWRFTCRYDFHKLTDSEWEAFISDGKKMQKKYKEHGKGLEMLFRNIFFAIQEFYLQIGEDEAK